MWVLRALIKYRSIVSFVSLERLGVIVLDGELGAALLAALGEHLAARSGLRADEETVRFCALALLRVVGKRHTKQP